MQIFDSYIEAGQVLNKKDKQAFYTALIEYLAYDKNPDLSGASLAVFTAIEPSLSLSKQRSKSGKAGAVKTNTKPDFADDFAERQNERQNEDLPSGKTEVCREICRPSKGNSKSIKKDNPNGLSKESPAKSPAKFAKPSAEQVATYATARGHPSFNAQKFIDYYESNGWKVGRNPMKDWQAAVRTWLHKEPDSEVKSEYSQYRFS